jgi:hypothetical protein
MAHIDTDEYIAINPFLRARRLGINSNNTTGTRGDGTETNDNKIGDNKSALRHLVSSLAAPNSIFHLYTSMMMTDEYSKRLTPVCQSMPTILFGSAEDIDDDDDTRDAPSLGKKNNEKKYHPFNRLHLGTIRWKYHAAWNDYRNGFQKVLMDLTLLPANDMILNPHPDSYAFNPHQPSNESCRAMTLFPATSAVRQYPLTLNHYVGSFERYSSRSSDSRRTRQVRNTRRHEECVEKSNVA